MRWIRLDLTWSHSAWLSVLSAESRLAWIELLCYVKGFGAAGRARAMTPDRFARMIYVGEESVRQMLKAAENDGALAIVEGDWLVVKWAKYQGDETGAERQARFKANRKARDGNGGNALVTVVTATETETETETKKARARAHPPVSWVDSLLPTLPESHRGLDVVKALRDYATHRKERGLADYKPTGLARFASEVGSWTPLEVIQSVNTALAKNWAGLFKPGTEPTKNGKSKVSDEPPAEYTVQ